MRPLQPIVDTVSITHLTLTDFRCYAVQRIEVDPGPVVLTGPNGAGKTNILEALSFLVPGRGLHRVKLSDLARWEGSGGWAVAARLQTPSSEFHLGTGLEADAKEGEKRIIRIDGTKMKNQSALAEVLSAVWLTPQMDHLFQDGPSARRRFIDRLAFGFDPAHVGRLSSYAHAMRTRMQLLKSQMAGKRLADPTWLTKLEAIMAEKGLAVVATRRDMVTRLNDSCRSASGPFPRATVSLNGEIETWLNTMSALDAEDQMKKMLEEKRSYDGESGCTSLGPHRSDLTIRHIEKNLLAEQCSTGERKALLVSIVLADARIQTMERGSAPLLLLDEVVAHLDSKRRIALFEELLMLSSQAWMTGTDAVLFTPLKGTARFMHVQDAVVTAM